MTSGVLNFWKQFEYTQTVHVLKLPPTSYLDLNLIYQYILPSVHTIDLIIDFYNNTIEKQLFLWYHMEFSRDVNLSNAIII